MLAKSRLNSIDTLVPQALIGIEISHEEFDTIMKEKKKYQKMKENMKNATGKQENMRLYSVNSKTRTKIKWKNNQKLLNIYTIKKICFLCVSIKWVKSAKKHTKNVKLKLLKREETFE